MNCDSKKMLICCEESVDQMKGKKSPENSECKCKEEVLPWKLEIQVMAEVALASHGNGMNKTTIWAGSHTSGPT